MGGMSFVEAVTALLAHLRLHRYSPATVHNYADQLKRFGEWLSRSLLDDLRRITRADIDAYQAYVRTEPIGAETRAIRLRAVKRLFDHLVREGRLLLHPADHVVEIRRKDRLPKAVLSVKQVRQLLAAPDLSSPYGLRDRALLELLYATGIRVGELEQVWLSDWEREERTLVIRHGKGGKQRMVPIGAAASQWLMRYVDEARPVLTCARPFERALFVVRGGTPLHTAQVRGILKAYRARCHLRRSVSPHALRHACATHLLQAGADIRAIQELLGHASLDSTAIYTRVAPVDLKAMHRRYHPGESKGPDHAAD
jgi:site-specific recombinase XerD